MEKIAFTILQRYGFHNGYKLFGHPKLTKRFSMFPFIFAFHMFRIKKLDQLVIKSYIGPLILTFFIAQFVLVMQFLWKYIDDLVGKGLDNIVVIKLIVYASATLVPMALPLGVLLASIMTYGKFGENYELTAVKSSGISLFRFMWPLIIFNFFLSLGGFWFSNNVIPKANLKFGALLYDIRKTKPTLNIEEGVFNDDIEGISIKCDSKDKDGKTLRGLIIYDHTSNQGNDHVIIAEKAEMVETGNDALLVMKLYNGSQYKEDLESPDPDKYELFVTNFKEYEKRFDLSQFAMKRTDENFFKNVSKMLNLRELNYRLDTIDSKLITKPKQLDDYLGTVIFSSSAVSDSFPLKNNLVSDEVMNKKGAQILASYSLPEQDKYYDYALGRARNAQGYISNNIRDIKYLSEDLVELRIERFRKFKLSIVILVFFFVGAPLGGIIRKGGLGWPLFISILVFITFYAINIIGEEMAGKMKVGVFTGSWLSIYVLLPIGIFLTIAANNDSSLFNKETYLKPFKLLFSKIKPAAH